MGYGDRSVQVSVPLARARGSEAPITAISVDVQCVREALLGSDKTQIEECLPRLERAIVVMQEIRATAQQRRDLAALRRDLAVVAGLAQSGEALYRGLGRLLGAAAGGYTPLGDGAPLHPSGTVLIQG